MDIDDEKSEERKDDVSLDSKELEDSGNGFEITVGLETDVDVVPCVDELSDTDSFDKDAVLIDGDDVSFDSVGFEDSDDLDESS